jgi:phenylpyruvate tautomerase PptA (4-oxalocrotonate tautomerase family)
MPFIHVYSFAGKDKETKQKAAQAIAKAVSETIGAPESAITVAYEDTAPETWDKNIIQGIIKPLRDKIIVDCGKLV